MTVVLALAGMLLNPTTIFRSIAAGAIAVVLVAVAASLTLLPALLAVMGDQVNALRVPVLFRRRQQDPDRTHGFWAGVARRVMARPVASLLVAVGILLVGAAAGRHPGPGSRGSAPTPTGSSPSRPSPCCRGTLAAA